MIYFSMKWIMSPSVPKQVKTPKTLERPRALRLRVNFLSSFRYLWLINIDFYGIIIVKHFGIRRDTLCT